MSWHNFIFTGAERTRTKVDQNTLLMGKDTFQNYIWFITIRNIWTYQLLWVILMVWLFLVSFWTIGKTKISRAMGLEIGDEWSFFYYNFSVEQNILALMTLFWMFHRHLIPMVNMLMLRNGLILISLTFLVSYQAFHRESHTRHNSKALFMIKQSTT